MATTIGTSWTTIGSKQVGTSGNLFNTTLRAYRSSSGSTTTIYWEYQVTPVSYAFTGTWANAGGIYSNMNGTQKNHGTYKWDGTKNTKTVASGNFSVNTASAWTGNMYAWTVYGYYSITESNSKIGGSCTVPASASAPTAPTISIGTVAKDGINVTYGTTNVGVPTATVYLYKGTTSNPTTSIDSKTTTGNTNVLDDDVDANTTYYYKATATNSAGSNSSSVVNTISFPPGVSSLSATAISGASVNITIACEPGGSAATTTLQMSTNNSSWSALSTNVDGKTVTTSVSGLTANTTYTRYFRVTSSAGTTESKAISFAIMERTHFYGSVNGNTKEIDKIYGSASSKATNVQKLYGAVDGKTKLVFRRWHN